VDQTTKEMVNSWKENRECMEPRACSEHSSRERNWQVPRWIKINTDAGFCLNSGAASIGIVARDDGGKVLLTAWRILNNCASAEEAEAEACLHGLRLTTEWIRKPACVESDCSNLIRDLGKKEENRGARGRGA
jgi:ribonuclease HI